MEIICFVLGVMYGFTFHLYLPLACFLLFFISIRYYLIVSFVLGLAFACMHLYLITPKNMPELEVLPQVQIEGSIVSMPAQNTDKTQFVLAIDRLDQHPVQGLVLLNWYNNKIPMYSGQHWRFTVKLKRPHNFQNPGSYDYAGFLATKHIYWTGYILKPKPVLLKPAPEDFSWLKIRERLEQQLYKLAPNEQTAGIIEALTLNLTNHISQDQWDLFRRTGTTHLFGISGEHIALVSGLVFGIFNWLWTRSQKLCLYLPAVYIASSFGLLSAWIYAFLAGFGAPVQRALIGCILYSVYCLGKQRFSSWQIWRYALVSVVCLEPHAVFMQGFYFSFLAVACLLLTQQRWQFKNYVAPLALQLSCLIGLMPLTLYWYAYGSINGFFANLFAIPLVGLIIVPLALLLLLVCTYHWAWLLMLPLSWLVCLLTKGLELVEKISFINFNWSLSSIEFACALMGALLLYMVLPVKPFIPIALLWLLLPFFPPRSLIQHGEASIQVLDVGQGLGVSIRTKNHILLFDTGDKFFSGSDLGKLVIVPYLNALNIKHIDTIVISHPHKDHNGGLQTIMQALPVNQLIVNDPDYYKQGSNCHNFPPWQWDGVEFRFFPISFSVKDKNNSCCVLHIKTAHGSVLLPGDIEKKAENFLVRTYGSALKSDVLIVPHHGSKTSSSPDFLQTVAPEYALASLGFDNRFGFPHDQTLSNYKNFNITFYRTDQCGMIEIKLPHKASMQQPMCWNNK